MKRPALERMGDRTVVTQDGCWEWRGGLMKNGYGQVHVTVDGKKRNFYTHRVGYEFFGGPIPEGLQIDHLCRNRCCWNPAHLECVTGAVNRSRGMGPSLTSARLSARTHCKYGHEFTPENIYRDTRGARQCRVCNRRRWRARRSRARSAD